MLSYQHIFHAGNLADVHKHSLLAWALTYLTQKEKPLTYIETHAGRGLYDLTDPAAIKTGEAAQGVARATDLLRADHPYRQVIDQIKARDGATIYPGSPVIAAELLRPMDNIHLAELHPTEFAALKRNMSRYGGIFRQRDGWELVQSICPPTPRRGLLLMDPSFEIKTDYKTIPDFIAKLHRKWAVGVKILWYPILTDDTHLPMTTSLKRLIPDGQCHEVRFAPARAGHRMIGSGLFVVNAPFGFDDAAAEISDLFNNAFNGPM